MVSFLSIVTLVVVMPYFAAAQGPPHIFVSSPNIVRVGNTETVLVSVYNPDSLEVTVSLNKIDGTVISSKVVNVSQDSPKIVSLFVDPAHVPSPRGSSPAAGDDVRQYINVKVECVTLDFVEEKEVLLSYEEGVVFIQTDKPIYTPDQTVNIRIMTLDQYMHPSAEPVQIDVLTPQDVIVHRASDVVSTNGFKSRTFRFPHEPKFGNWTVVASYGPENSVNTSVQFEVKEYVLPTFSVKIAAPDYILEGQEVVDCSLEARYVYKKTVHGSFYARIGVLHLDGEIEIHTDKEGQIYNGQGDFRIQTSELGDNWFNENLGARLYLEVSVLETATGYSEKATDVSAKFVVSPYVFTWHRTVPYFKKGLPYEVKTDLKYTNGKPAPNVNVQVTATATTVDGQEQHLFGEEEDESSLTDSKGQVNCVIFVPTNCENIHVRLQTVDANLDEEVNGLLEFTIMSETSPSDDFLLIRLTRQVVSVDDDLNVEALLQTNDVVPYLSYYVITKGRIVHAGILNFLIGNIQGFNVPVTYDMIPSSRIVAYYINSNDQVVADSLWMDIDRICENRVSVSVVDSRPFDTFDPETNIELQIDALPQTTVGLLAIDKAVLLLRNYHRLSRKKMYSTMDSHDSGCGPGGGRDSSDIFKNAGVTILSNVDFDVSRREEYECATPTNPRRRRSLESLRDDYREDPMQDFACRRGQKELRGNSGLSCQDRLQRFWLFALNRHPNISEERQEELFDIYTICCEGGETAHNGNRGRILQLPTHGSSDDLPPDTKDIRIRTDFRETWIFEEVEIGNSGFARLPYTIPGSITEWSVQAVGLSEHYAMCIAEPLDVLVESDFFIQLRVPYSVVRMEQVEIVVTIFNYGQQSLNVDVYLETTEMLCSEGIANELSGHRDINVARNESIKYVIIGLEVGEHPIKIVAIANGKTDGIIKNLRVVGEGFEKTHHHAAVLDPSGTQDQQLGSGPQEGNEDFGSHTQVRDAPMQARAGRLSFRVNEVNNAEAQHQIHFFDVRLPPNAVPGTESCEVSIIGNLLGPVITSAIDGLDSLLVLPRGCGEQTMIHMAPNVYVLRYLTSLHSEDEVVMEKARSNIEEGILREMTHRHLNGSFSVWGNNPSYPSSTWLTAFVAKVFCHANEFVFVDPHVTCDAIHWLITSAQREDGAFFEGYQVHHREMTGGLQGDATITAFVLIAIHECECASQSDEVAAATVNATSFLHAQLGGLRRPYAMAIVTYALALVGSPQKDRANSLLRSIANYDEENNHRFWGADSSSLANSDRPYWYQVRPTAIMVETTGYALLAQLALGEVSYSHAIVNWLSVQQNYGGGFISTQDTVIALQALSEFAIMTDQGDIDMECEVRHEDSNYEEMFHFTNENYLVQQHATPPAKGQLSVESRGRGTGKLNVRVKYNVLDDHNNSDGCAFALDINARETRDANVEKPEVKGPIKAPQSVGRGDMSRSRIGGRDKRQAAQDGNRGHLILNVEVGVRYLRGERTGMAIIDVGIYTGFEPIEADLMQIVQESNYIGRYEVSQRSVIFYANEIPASRITVAFTVKRITVVGNIQPVVVKVYDYYNPSEQCSKFYHPANGSPLLQTICEGRTCTCAAAPCYNCTTQSGDQLLTGSCKSASTYAYKIQVTRKRVENGFNMYQATIVKVFKAGDDRDILPQETRSFWVRSSCSCTKPIKQGSSYLVIGQVIVPYVDEVGNNGFKYLIDSTTMVEFWPNNKRRNKSQYKKLQKFDADMVVGNNRCH